MTKKKINKKQEKQKLNYLALGSVLFGVSFGTLVGLTVFDNVAIGIGIGIGSGLAMGLLSLGVAFDNSTDENKH